MKVSLRTQAACAALVAVLLAVSFVAAAAFYRAGVLVADFNGLATLGVFGFVYMSSAIFMCRAILWVAPLRPGVYSYHDLGSLTVMYAFLEMFIRGSLISTGALPLLLRPFYYSLMGARVGRDVMLNGVVFEPAMMTFGNRVVLGEGCVVGGHCTEGGVTTIAPVVLEDDVTVGANAVLFPGVRVGAGAVIATSSVVLKGTVIPSGEIWGGIPARRIKSAVRESRVS